LAYRGPVPPKSLVLDGLNPQQTAAVEAVRGPVCILAGAGSGKTTTITRRIAHQVASGAFEAGSILAVTFTNKAAREMAGRLSRLGVTGVIARTFHAAALKQLGYFSHAPVGQILSSKGRILYPLARSLPKPYRFQPTSDIATEIEWAKNQRIPPDAYAQRVGDHASPIPVDLMAGIYASYEKRKSAEGVIDFEDVLEHTTQMFRRDESAAEMFRARYRAFTVDEYQDVNLLQQSLLEVWLGGRDDLCVVGDDYQSIYSFTGASPDHLLKMPLRYPGAQVFRLESNYRSTPEVIELANKLVPKLGGAEKVLKAAAHSGPAPTLKAFREPDAEREWIVGAIKELHAAGTAYESIAILYRINARSEDHEEALTSAGIPFQVKGGSFLHRPAARALIPKLQRARTREVAKTVKTLARAAGLRDDAGDLTGEEATRQADLERLVEMAVAFEDGERTAIDFVTDLEARFAADAESTGVQLLTLHRSKGLEFDAVFLPGLEEGELPFRRADITEERRLLYVGLTRARTHLNVTWCSGGRRTPSRFVAELGVGRAAPEGSPAARKRKKIDGHAAVEGMAVKLQGGFSGEVVSVDEHGALVSLTGGGQMAVRYDDTVEVDGVRKPLVRPEPGGPLYSALKEWRLTRSKEDSVPAYVVFHDATLGEIAAAKPQSLGQLAAIPGVGPSKLDRYGPALLELIAAHA
jgi:DNA helicase-2/ATP-dependent DNA helicase PcrA